VQTLVFGERPKDGDGIPDTLERDLAAIAEADAVVKRSPKMPGECRTASAETNNPPSLP